MTPRNATSNSSVFVFLLVSVIITNSFTLINCLHQDQVGKFDWRKQSTGIPTFVYQHPGLDNLIIGTESNVIASIHVKDGSIIWRQLLGNGCTLNHMSILKSSEETRDFLVRTSCLSEEQTNQTQIWTPQNGLLVSEARYKDFIEDDQSESQLANRGHVVGSSRAFSLTDDTGLLVNEDGKVTYQAHGRDIWSREESLASVVAADIVKLPLGLRDSFGLKKTVVVVTRSGKMFGIDTITGDTVWHIFEKDLATNQHESNHILLMMTKQSDEDVAESSALVIHPKGLILRLNPVTGEVTEKKRLPSSLKQVASTEAHGPDQIRGVLILDTQYKVYIYPENLISHIKDDLAKYYMTVAERSPAKLSGYRFVLDVHGEIKPQEIWRLPFNETERIINISIKRVDEEIHSPARVLGDRGILYKYVNPNLIGVLTEGSSGDLCSPDHSINIYLVDGVTGALVHSIHHPKSRTPSNMVHSENWLVYSYFNTKSRRTELSSLEMFEGVHQINSTAFSSLTRSQIKPRLIEHKTFIFPAGIDAMVDTVTLRGMTNRHIIVALPSGALLEIPKIFLDPRRPQNILPEHREEGLIPYTPELPVPSDSIINYDQTLLKVRRIITSPAILESTSLVFAYGLDLFFTRVTPSKTFDILKDDFDHVLITGVLIFLVVASFVSKYLAQRKALHAAWQ